MGGQDYKKIIKGGPPHSLFTVLYIYYTMSLGCISVKPVVDLDKSIFCVVLSLHMVMKYKYHGRLVQLFVIFFQSVITHVLQLACVKMEGIFWMKSIPTLANKYESDV